MRERHKQLSERVSLNIRVLLLRQGKNTVQLAKHLGISSQMVSGILGLKYPLYFTDAIKIAKYLGVKLDDLVRDV